jgi:hypothetical protein
MSLLMSRTTVVVAIRQRLRTTGGIECRVLRRVMRAPHRARTGCLWLTYQQTHVCGPDGSMAGWPSALVNGTARPSLRLPPLEVIAA